MKKLHFALAILFVFSYFQALGQSPEINIDTLIKELGIRESKQASRDMDGWSRPEKITMRYFSNAKSGLGSKAWFLEVADGVNIEFVRSSTEVEESIVKSDAYIGGCSNLIGKGENLDYVHITSAGIDRCGSIPGIKTSNLIATNNAKASSETIAEHSIALMMALTRRIPMFQDLKGKSDWSRGSAPNAPNAISVKGKTLLVLGLGGIGNQVAKRGNGLGMRVIGTRNSSRTGPDYVDYVGLSDETVELAKQADVVVNALPLTDKTRSIVGQEFFNNLKDGSYYISVGRGKTTDTEALITALKNGKLSGVGLDVTDPEPLTKDHELWSMPNVIITQHTAGRSDLSRRNSLMITRENLRRYIQGEKLLNMVDLSRGY
ncbi:D-2-hydroxyacid dehydrogenase [Seonamhaeicola maritimus]|uniref:D-2-hydroxyacid dehydrogenase n=1 Tax=Seonamhaeicola maritimus TaxID=2591822 RepID=A0A5C7GMJ4_9FLAO|nr:D-2-hydroxyacid dehydrogenase [Seonamhaeicola maritimus]TXG39287.1 D-2-hydroxyacid dehydrogenase [Seonamhaeicola maritimus]